MSKRTGAGNLALVRFALEWGRFMIRVPHRNDARHWAYLSLVVMLMYLFRMIYRVELHPSRAQLRGPCLFVSTTVVLWTRQGIMLA